MSFDKKFYHENQENHKVFDHGNLELYSAWLVGKYCKKYFINMCELAFKEVK